MNRQANPILVYVVEDDEAVQKSICALLGAHGHATMPFQSAEDFLASYEPGRKSCLVLDLRLPGMSGTHLQKRLAELGAALPTIIVTAHGDIPLAVEAMRAGAIDFIEKPAQPDQLLEAIRVAADLIEGRARAEVPKKIVTDRLGRLTERERQVLGHLLQGKLSKEIAAELGISQRTVEVHRARVREKMQARGIADLIRMLS